MILCPIPGRRFSLLPSIFSPGWQHPLSRDTIPQVASAIATWLPTDGANWGRSDRFRPTARYSAATTACGATPLEIAAEYRAIVRPITAIWESPLACLLAAFALLMPRLAIALLWLFSHWFDGLFTSLLWPILGFVFLPTTILWYSTVQHWFGGTWTLWPGGGHRRGAPDRFVPARPP